ncbi:MAG: ATP synthase subunit I [Rhodocyclaceae bacterium]|nr:ATP synthase subunit I [Rhodocyclaceae bacterium]
MNSLESTQGLPPQVRWILSRQAGFAAALATGAWAWVDGNAAVSVLAGGACGILANLAYAWRATCNVRLAGVGAPVSAFRAQAAGEAYKFAATLALFALIFVFYKKVAPLPLFLGYISTFAIFWMALLKPVSGKT